MRSFAQFVGRNVGVLAFSLVLSASLAFNVSLARRLQEFNAPRPAGFQAGDNFPSLGVTSVTGGMEALRFDRPTLLYVFSPTCRWCQRDHQSLLAITAHVGRTFDIIGVARAAPQGILEQYLEAYPFPGTVFMVPEEPSDAAVARNLTVTPQLLVIDKGGAIQRAWIGALMDDREKEAEGFFGIDLPGPTRDVATLN